MISIVLPFFNEEENIKRVETELIPVLDNLKAPYEIIAVDDGSVDRSVEEVNKLSKNHSHIRLVKHEQNKGLGCAVRTGIKEAGGECIVTLDADFTFHPRQIPALLEEYKKTNADCIIGSHFLKKETTEKVIWYRLILSKSVNWTYRILLGQKISAISSIFRLYKTQPLKELELTSTGFDINAEILFKLIQSNKVVREVPAELTTRIHGLSKLNTKKEVLNHLKLLLKIIRWKMRMPA